MLFVFVCHIKALDKIKWNVKSVTRQFTLFCGINQPPYATDVEEGHHHRSTGAGFKRFHVEANSAINNVAFIEECQGYSGDT